VRGGIPRISKWGGSMNSNYNDIVFYIAYTRDQFSYYDHRYCIIVGASYRNK